MRKNVVREKDAQLVSVEDDVFRRTASDRRSQPVGVRIVGDGQLALVGASDFEQAIEGARFLGIGKGHRREPGVRLGLIGNGVDGVEATALRGLEKEALPAAVERGIGNAHRRVGVLPRWKCFEVSLVDCGQAPHE